MAEVPNNFPSFDEGLEALPLASCERVSEIADEIIRLSGTDRSTESRSMYDAEWDDNVSGRRYELRRYIRRGYNDFRLDVYEPLSHEAYAHYYYNSSRAGVYIYEDSEYRVQRRDVSPMVAEQQMISHLRTSNMVPSARSQDIANDYAFWDQVCMYVADDPSVKAIIERINDPEESTPAAVLYGMATEAARTIEPVLTIGLLAKVIGYAHDIVEASD